MTDDEIEITEDDLQQFDEKTKEERLEILERLHRKASDSDEDFGVSGTFTARVLDEDGEEKKKVEEEFEY